MRTRPDKKWPGKYSRFVLSKSIRNLLSFLVISPPNWEILLVMRTRTEKDGLCVHVYVTAASRSLNTRRGTRRSSLLFPRVTSWCEVRITGLHRISNTFVTWHASLFLSPSFAVSLSLVLRGELVPATIPRYTSSSRFPQRQHIPFRVFRDWRTIGGRTFEQRSTDTLDSIVAHRQSFLSPHLPAHSWRRAHFRSLPSYLVASLPPPIQSGLDWSHLPNTWPMVVF